MKTSFLILTIALLFGNIANGQNTIAKFKYEEAEAAYEKKDYVTTLNKLTEVEGILKSTNPKIMYLRIMAQSDLIFTTAMDIVVDYDVLESTVKLSSKYLKEYESLPDNEDKYRDIYHVSERIAKFPKTLAEIEAGRKRPMNFITESDNNVLDFYKIKPNMKWEEYKTYNAQAASLLTDFYQPESDDNEKVTEFKRSQRREGKALWQNRNQRNVEGLNEVETTNGIVTGVEYCLRSSIDYTDVEKRFFEVMAEMTKRIPKSMEFSLGRQRRGLNLDTRGSLERKPDADIDYRASVGMRDFPNEKYNLLLKFSISKRK